MLHQITRQIAWSPSRRRLIRYNSPSKSTIPAFGLSLSRAHTSNTGARLAHAEARVLRRTVHRLLWLPERHSIRRRRRLLLLLLARLRRIARCEQVGLRNTRGKHWLVRRLRCLTLTELKLLWSRLALLRRSELRG